MAVERGSIFTPDKKKYLILEIERELSSLRSAIPEKSGKLAETLQKIEADLKKQLSDLYDKKGVVTPQETDNILDLISSSKRSRLEAGYVFGLRRSTVYLLGFLAIGIGAYVYYKKRA
jgi:hypothetical protein